MATAPKKTAPATKAAAKKAPAKKAAARKTTARKKAGNKLAELPEDHTPSQAAAHGILEERRDLQPSVDHIMNAELSEDGRMHAIGLFKDSLTTPGDPNRTPANAVEAAREATDD